MFITRRIREEDKEETLTTLYGDMDIKYGSGLIEGIFEAYPAEKSILCPPKYRGNIVSCNNNLYIHCLDFGFILVIPYKKEDKSKIIETLLRDMEMLVIERLLDCIEHENFSRDKVFHGSVPYDYTLHEIVQLWSSNSDLKTFKKRCNEIETTCFPYFMKVVRDMKDYMFAYKWIVYMSEEKK